MKSTVEPVEGNKVRVSVEVDAEEFESAIAEAFRKIAREVRIPGFRPGRAPRKVLEARLGADVARGQALQDAIPDYYVAAVREHSVDVIAAPEIDITSGQEDGAVTFDAVVEVRPEVVVGGYASLQVTVPVIDPTDDEIDAQIERLQASSATYEAADRPAEAGDRVVIDINGLLDGEPAPGLTAEEYSYEVGSGGITAEVDEQLIGASAGDELSFDSAHPVREDATLHFDITVREVLARVLPDLDDAFAAEVSEFGTLAELRADLVERAGRVRRAQASMVLRDRVGEAIAGLVTDDVPDALVDGELQQRLADVQMRMQAQGIDLGTWLAMQNRSPEEFVAELRTTAETAARLDLALRAVAEREEEGEGVEQRQQDEVQQAEQEEGGERPQAAAAAAERQQGELSPRLRKRKSSAVGASDEGGRQKRQEGEGGAAVERGAAEEGSWFGALPVSDRCSKCRRCSVRAKCSRCLFPAHLTHQSLLASPSPCWRADKAADVAKQALFSTTAVGVCYGVLRALYPDAP